MATVISSKDQGLKARRTTRKSARKSEAPSEDEVRILAYTLYEQRNADGGQGDEFSDWIEAERRLSSAD
jgi:Protein of unknown function (DUF2934)